MIVQSERNIDLLLGLLTYVGWYVFISILIGNPEVKYIRSQYQIRSCPFLAVLTQLALSLVFDLQLNKPILKEAQAIPCAKEQQWKSITPRTMEERRAVLGCFLISSMYA